MGLTYWYLVAWLAGGIVLATLLLVRTVRRPFALSFALLGFGGAGALTRGIGYDAWQITLAYALGGAALAALFGYALQRLSR